MTTYIQRFFLAAALLLLAACSTTGSNESTPVEQKREPAPDSVRPVAVQDNGLSKEDIAALNDPANPLSKRSVYFDLDSSVIKSEYQPVVGTHGQFLSKKSAVKVTVRGNTDERGSREYNIALGQRRADVVKQALQSQGVPDSQIEAVSFGSEKPLTEGHSEDAWKKNRRADIAYPGE